MQDHKREFILARFSHDGTRAIQLLSQPLFHCVFASRCEAGRRLVGLPGARQSSARISLERRLHERQFGAWQDQRKPGCRRQAAVLNEVAQTTILQGTLAQTVYRQVRFSAEFDKIRGNFGKFKKLRGCVSLILPEVLIR